MGANSIRLHKNDRNHAGAEFIRFTAAEDAVVYVLKREKSGASLSGWTLVSGGFPAVGRTAAHLCIFVQ